MRSMSDRAYDLPEPIPVLHTLVGPGRTTAFVRVLNGHPYTACIRMGRRPASGRLGRRSCGAGGENACHYPRSRESLKPSNAHSGSFHHDWSAQRPYKPVVVLMFHCAPFHASSPLGSVP